jgi:hypothetical protein
MRRNYPTQCAAMIVRWLELQRELELAEIKIANGWSIILKCRFVHNWRGGWRSPH